MTAYRRARPGLLALSLTVFLVLGLTVGVAPSVAVLAGLAVSLVVAVATLGVDPDRLTVKADHDLSH